MSLNPYFVPKAYSVQLSPLDRNASDQTSPFFHITGCQFHRQPHDLAVGGQSSRREQLDGAIEYNIDQGLRKYTNTHASIAPSQQPGGGKVLRNTTNTPKFATAQSYSIACLLLTTNSPSYQPERIESIRPCDYNHRSVCRRGWIAG